MGELIQSNKYCFSEAEKAVKYTDNAARWTPNNLRRLMISPDCVIAQFHVGEKPRQRSFNPNRYMSCISDAKYIRMTNVLGGRSGQQICSHVEEVVYCLKGMNGGVLHQDEADWRAIISTDKASNSPEALIKSIGERFRRLRAFVLFNGTIQELMQLVSSNLANPLYQIADDINVNSTGKFSIIDVHKNDWFKGSYFRPTIYPSDTESGSLYKRIKTVEAKLTAQAEMSKKQANKDSAFKSFESKFEDAYTRFTDMFVQYKKIAMSMLKEQNKSYLSAQFCGDFDIQHCSEAHGKSISDYFDLIPNSMVEDLKRLGIDVSKSKSEITGDSIQESIKLLDIMYAHYYKALVYNYLKFFASLKRTGKFDRFVEKFCNVKILIPDDVNINSEAKVLSDLEGFGSGKNIANSVNIISDTMTAVFTQ